MDDRKKGEGEYYEAHHIVPRCFKKRSDTVLLTPHEHYTCHKLLVEHFGNHTYYGEKLMWAFHRMAYGNGFQMTADEYSETREMLMPLWQIAKTPATKRSMSDSHKGKKYFKCPETGNITVVRAEDAQPFIDAGWENTHWSKGVAKAAKHRARLSDATTRRLTGLTGENAQASKGPYSIVYEDGRIITEYSVPLLASKSGIKMQTLYYRLKNRNGLTISGYAVTEGAVTP